MRKIASMVMATALILTFVIPVGIAGDTNEINISLITTVDLKVVNLTRGAYWDINGSYGIIGGNLNSTHNSTKYMVTNNGTINIDVTVNATDTNNWTLETTEGYNNFVLKHNQTGSWTMIQESQAIPFLSNFTVSGIEYFWFQVDMPTTSESAEEQKTIITFDATAR